MTMKKKVIEGHGAPQKCGKHKTKGKLIAKKSTDSTISQTTNASLSVLDTEACPVILGTSDCYKESLLSKGKHLYFKFLFIYRVEKILLKRLFFRTPQSKCL